MTSSDSVSPLRGIPLLPNPHGRLSQGCYSVLFTPDEPYNGADDHPDDIRRGVRWYPGTLRVAWQGETPGGWHRMLPNQPRSARPVRISGDLYASAPETPLPGYLDIPVFPRREYRFHLRGDGVRALPDGGFELSLASHEASPEGWRSPQSFIVRLKWCDPPEGAQRPTDCLSGEVFTTAGKRAGTFEMTWVSPFLRRAVVELDTIGSIRPPSGAVGLRDRGSSEVVRPGAESFEAAAQQAGSGESEQDTPAQGDGAGAVHTWESVFADLGWRMEWVVSDIVAQPASRVWAEFELHQALPALRDSVDTDREWRYHVFCVGQLEDSSRGFKFDTRGSGAGSGLFESVVLAARYRFPEDPSAWGDALAGKTLDETPLYFRVAVHEVGHAMKLDHNDETLGFMATTDVIRDKAVREDSHANSVVSKVEWSFAPSDQERLRHWPDITVRPGGWVPPIGLPGIDEAHGEATSTDSDPEADMTRLSLELAPIQLAFPYGAPVRIGLTLSNRGTGSVRVPALRLKSGNLSGVVRYGDEERAFFPIARAVDDWCPDELDLEPEKARDGALCLLRGREGPLFPHPGVYKVVVQLEWFASGVRKRLVASTGVTILPPVDERHTKVATRLMDTADTLEGFAIGGDGFADGNQAINLALTDSVLRAHFAVIELRRLARDYGTIPGRLDLALKILADPDDRRWVLCKPEVERLKNLLALGDRKHGTTTDSEKCHVAMRIVFGRISRALVDEFSAFSGSYATEVAGGEGGRVAARSGTRSRGDAEAGRAGVIGGIPEGLAEALLPPDWQADYLRAHEQRPEQEGDRREANSGKPKRLALGTLEKTGIGTSVLAKMLRRVEELGVTPLEMGQASQSLVRALRRISIPGTANATFRLRAVLVANFVSNLIAAGLEEADAVLDAALEAPNEVIEWDRKVRSRLDFDPHDPEVARALSALSTFVEARSGAFSSLVLSALDSPVLGDAAEERIREMKSERMPIAT